MQVALNSKNNTNFTCTYLNRGYTECMTPIFKSTYSIGKSILTLDDSEESDGPDSIITICNDNDIKTLVLVEDRMTGFIKAHNVCKDNDIQLIFGLRITCCNDVTLFNKKNVAKYDANYSKCRRI